jgi:hypothetical protein
MARTNIPAQPRVGPYPTQAQLDDGDLIPSLTSISDPTDRYTALVDNKTSVMAVNSDSAPHDITITAAPDTPFNRAVDLVVTLAAGEIAVLGPFKQAGWSNSLGPTNNLLFIDVSDPKVQMAVLTEL